MAALLGAYQGQRTNVQMAIVVAMLAVRQGGVGEIGGRTGATPRLKKRGKVANSIFF
jgi:hypothetical protein